MNKVSTLSIPVCKKLGECVYANYHRVGYGFDYRFLVNPVTMKGLYVTKWAAGCERSKGYPNNWEVYELSFGPEPWSRGSIGKRLGVNMTEDDIIDIAERMKSNGTAITNLCEV